MGGPKKRRPITKREPKRRMEVKKPELQKTIREVVVTDKLLTQIERDTSKMKCITPYILAARYNVRISIAKNILRKLSEKELIKKISSNRRTLVYTPIIEK